MKGSKSKTSATAAPTTSKTGATASSKVATAGTGAQSSSGARNPTTTSMADVL